MSIDAKLRAIPLFEIGPHQLRAILPHAAIEQMDVVFESMTSAISHGNKIPAWIDWKCIRVSPDQVISWKELRENVSNVAAETETASEEEETIASLWQQHGGRIKKKLVDAWIEQYETNFVQWVARVLMHASQEKKLAIERLLKTRTWAPDPEIYDRVIERIFPKKNFLPLEAE